MKAHEKLHSLWFEVKSQEDCLEYIDELLDQVKLFGIETNKLTKEHVQKKLETILDGIRQTWS